MANQDESPLNFRTYIQSTTINVDLSTKIERVVDITTKQGIPTQLTVGVHEALTTDDIDQVLLKMGTTRDPLCDMSTVANQVSTVIAQYTQAFSASQDYNDKVFTQHNNFLANNEPNMFKLAEFARLVASCGQKLKDAGDTDLVGLLQLSVLVAVTGGEPDQATKARVELLHQSKKALITGAVDDFRVAACGLCGFVFMLLEEETVVPADKLANVSLPR